MFCPVKEVNSFEISCVETDLVPITSKLFTLKYSDEKTLNKLSNRKEKTTRPSTPRKMFFDPDKSVFDIRLIRLRLLEV